jgi:hypothetical protein
MRSDYPNSDLINKVNSEWINKVLIHPELCRDDPLDDEDDGGELALRRDLAAREAIPLPREPVQVLADLRKLRHPPPRVTVVPVARSSRRRSITRRVTERLVLGVAALGVGAAVWIAQGFQDATNAVSGREANAASEETAGLDATALKSTEPAWLAPEMLYATAIAPAPARRAAAPAFLPKPGR